MVAAPVGSSSRLGEAMASFRGMGRTGKRVLIPAAVCLILLLTYREYSKVSTQNANRPREDIDNLREGEIMETEDIKLPKFEGANEEEMDTEISDTNDEVDSEPSKNTVQLTPISTTKNPQFIHIISYQRSGSSYIGKLFDIYEPAFFVYEPLEMLYTALYGVQEDNVVPHNIFFDHQANFRQLDPPELAMTQWTMEQVYQCNIAAFPTAMLVNIFWAKFTKFMTVGIPFVQCLEELGVNMTLGYDTLKQCQSHIRAPCAGTFTTQQGEKLDQCKDVLHYNGEWQTSVNPEAWKKYENTDFYNNRDRFQKYFDCLSQYQEGVQKCARVHLDQECEKKSLRVIKTVRAPMELAEKLLEKYLNFQVIHLYRDPRGVTLSRMKADWSYSVFETSDPSILSQTYCRVIMNEIFKRKKLELKYPGRLVSIIHDKILENIAETTQDLFSKLNLEYSDEVQEYVELNTKLTKRDRWRTTLRLHEIQAIEKECSDLFQEAEFQAYEASESEKKMRDNRLKAYMQQKIVNQVRDKRRDAFMEHKERLKFNKYWKV